MGRGSAGGFLPAGGEDKNPSRPRWKWLLLVRTLTSATSASWRLQASFSQQQSEPSGDSRPDQLSWLTKSGEFDPGTSEK